MSRVTEQRGLDNQYLDAARIDDYVDFFVRAERALFKAIPAARDARDWSSLAVCVLNGRQAQPWDTNLVLGNEDGGAQHMLLGEVSPLIA
jgi:hypothetical protein